MSDAMGLASMIPYGTDMRSQQTNSEPDLLAMVFPQRITPQHFLVDELNQITGALLKMVMPNSCIEGATVTANRRLTPDEDTKRHLRDMAERITKDGYDPNEILGFGWED